MPSITEQSRRKFLQFMAASPLFASGAIAGEVPTVPVKPTDPIMWAPLQTDKLIKSPKEAINVFDFEAPCRVNVPPSHFGYMASGIDDEVTLRANREGFLKFQLRPRRLVDVSKVDMSVDIHDRGRRRRHRSARRAGLVPALCVEQLGRGEGAGDAGREGRLPRGRGDRGPLRRTQSGNAVPITANRHPRLLHVSRSHQSDDQPGAALDVPGHRPDESEEHSIVGHDLGFPQAAARHHQDENRAQGHPRL
jgi:hypothetical protein